MEHEYILDFERHLSEMGEEDFNELIEKAYNIAVGLLKNRNKIKEKQLT